MQYVMLIYHGSTPLPGSEASEALSEDEKKQIYADYGALNKTPGVTPGLPLGLPDNAAVSVISPWSERTFCQWRSDSAGSFVPVQRAARWYHRTAASGSPASSQ